MVSNFKVGDRVALASPMVNDPAPIEMTDKGTVTGIADFGDVIQLSVQWDSGRMLGLVIPPDNVTIIGRFEAAEEHRDGTPDNVTVLTAYGAACDMEKDYGTPVIVVHPGRLGGTPTIGHSRLPASLIANVYWNHGADEVKRMWDYVTDADILVCCWFVAHYGSRSHRRRFKDWRDQADMLLWSRETFADCPWPPRRHV